jgi:hypothetical protein
MGISPDFEFPQSFQVRRGIQGVDVDYFSNLIDNAMPCTERSTDGQAGDKQDST